MPNDAINKFLGALTQDETATVARRALGMLDDDTGIQLVLDWAKAERLLDELADAVEEAGGGEDDDEEGEEDEDEEDEEPK